LGGTFFHLRMTCMIRLLVAVSGCTYRGQLYRSGSQWVSDVDPCVHYHCQAAVLTRSVTKCVITCSHPIIVPNHCCPHCPGEMRYVRINWRKFARQFLNLNTSQMPTAVAAHKVRLQKDGTAIVLFIQSLRFSPCFTAVELRHTV